MTRLPAPPSSPIPERSRRTLLYAGLAGLFALAVASCGSASDREVGSSTGGRGESSVADPAFSRLAEPVRVPILAGSGTFVAIAGDVEPAGEGMLRPRLDIDFINVDSNEQTRARGPQGDMSTAVLDIVGLDSGFVALAELCPEGNEMSESAENEPNCARPHLTTYITKDLGRSWSEVSLPSNASTPKEASDPWAIGGDLLAVPGGGAAIVYSPGPLLSHNSATQVAVLKDGKWSDPLPMGTGSASACATDNAIHLIHSATDQVLWTLEMDTRSVATSDVPDRILPEIAPDPLFACDQASVVLVSTATDQSSNMTIQRWLNGNWTEQEVSDSPGAVPLDVFSSGAGVIVRSEDLALGRELGEHRVRLIDSEGRVVSVIDPEMAASYIVPGIESDRVALLGPFSRLSTAPIGSEPVTRAGSAIVTTAAFE